MELAIPVAKMSHLTKFNEYELPNIELSSSIFTCLEIIGQLDNKFIIGFSNTLSLIVLFDQHAVHERIRLEKLLKGKCLP